MSNHFINTIMSKSGSAYTPSNMRDHDLQVEDFSMMEKFYPFRSVTRDKLLRATPETRKSVAKSRAISTLFTMSAITYVGFSGMSAVSKVNDEQSLMIHRPNHYFGTWEEKLKSPSIVRTAGSLALGAGVSSIVYKQVSKGDI